MGSSCWNYMIVWHMSSGWDNLNILSFLYLNFWFLITSNFPFERKILRFAEVLPSLLCNSFILMQSVWSFPHNYLHGGAQRRRIGPIIPTYLLLTLWHYAVLSFQGIKWWWWWQQWQWLQPLFSKYLPCNRHC